MKAVENNRVISDPNTEINRIKEEVERLKNRQPELPSTGVTENIISENQRLRELISKMRGQWIHSIHKDECLAALEGRDELDNNWPIDRSCDD